MLLLISIVVLTICAFWLGYRLGSDAMQEHWIEQTKREERARHMTQGNAFWQK
jgi:hypothetical protein